MDQDNSFDEKDSIDLDLNCIVPEFEDVDDSTEAVPVKKLSEMFDTCVKGDNSPAGNMKVFLRVRPIAEKLENTISIESDTSIVTNAPDISKRAQYTKKEERHYAFTKVFGPSSDQSDIFEQIVSPLFEKFMQGDSCVLFAYGMTNAGKTYTIQGTPHEEGILPRIVSAILDKTQELSSQHSSSSKFEVNISMMEIYQEKIYDLLAKKKEKLNIRDGNGKVEVQKLLAHPISSAQDSIKLLSTAALNRSKSHTLLNSGSSRSHAIYSVQLVKTIMGRETTTVFQLVDLAGAERSNRTKTTAAHQKEANNINMSLMQLWRCLQGMKRKSGDASADIIPFRESKLTHILMPLLYRVGTAGVAMITCINPQGEDYDETLSILGNASIACKIKEIADVGRVASTSGRSSTLATTLAAAAVEESASTSSAAAATSAVASGIAAWNAKIASASSSAATVSTLGKKRKHDSTKSSLLMSASHRDSTLAVGISKDKKSSLLASQSGAGKKCKSRKESEEEDKDAASVVIDGDESSATKRMRIAIANLEEENRQLQMNQIARETEIRIEVSEEMASRSSHLLTQIQALQNQLSEKEFSMTEKFDVTRSCKKMQQKQRLLAHKDVERDLQEVEAELERTKENFLSQISSLTAENKGLKNEVNFWKNRAELSEKKLSEIQNPFAHSGIKPASNPFSTQPTVDPLPALSSPQASSEFSQRMQRDARFKKNESSIIILSELKQKESRGDSPSRSPMKRSPLGNHDSNSPIRLGGLKICKKKGQSPNVGSENAQTKYLQNESVGVENIAVSIAPSEHPTRTRPMRACTVGRL